MDNRTKLQRVVESKRVFSGWTREGRSLLIAAKDNRERFELQRLEIEKLVNQHGNHSQTCDAISKAHGLAVCSMLTLAYSIEMVLKGGLAKVYRGCSEEMFNHDLKNRFGHSLRELAKEVSFSIQPDDVQSFKLLEEICTNTRYPCLPDEKLQHVDDVNDRTRKFWRRAKFAAAISLAERVLDHVRIIDRDKKNPSEFRRCDLPNGGWIALRRGGHVASRLTFELSKSSGRETLKPAIDKCKAYLNSQVLGDEKMIILEWNPSSEDGRKRTRPYKSLAHIPGYSA